MSAGWGSNEYGQLGDGTQQKRRTPTVTPLPGDAKASIVTAGSYHSLVLTETGEVLAAGECFQSCFLAITPEKRSTKGYIQSRCF